MDAKNSTQQTALVTGGNKGIGFETARQLAQRGFTVWLGAGIKGGARLRPGLRRFSRSST
ncbi:SDR family NAD(P)-dependent oxidoreductase [Kineosporia sp. NBRC 101731]|uniref:SDR family NAD(P)-dependent oxidoreductase n=1 Tax=Kineosporia sp. NBRC 101731 TaxID=3032199 RepID=UPI0024A0C9D9|nr:SDR family NAD(P)-dependent oxidoreductase [Kineosporia sp. NBRC 101731]GLY28143.1 hypothetical protein Kisp02_15080 [Kineosporia sp. NBRC 101731]